jgi:alginate O-acetyltransferase complex protein AlgI
MNFVSIEFAVLFTITVGLLFLVKNPLFNKIILLIASCLFYAWWDWRFLFLFLGFTVLNYYMAQSMSAANDTRKRQGLLWSSVALNLVFLGFFKYFNFFVDSLNALTTPLGWQMGTLNIILPLGISFYTFVTIGYVVDIYRDTSRPAKSLLDYAIFILFFPRLVAGPIMRAREFLPQLERGVEINFSNLTEGVQIFLRGLLKKMVVADNVSIMVNQIYQSPSVLSSSTVWLGIFAYSVQILCDFSGYTDMAHGVAKILGFKLPRNFDLPYTAQSVTEFWKRWHISLSSWFRDYVFFPLERKRFKWGGQSVNVLIVFALTGLWHGASWNFVLWGGLHGIYLVLERLLLGKRTAEGPWTSPLAWLRALLVFSLVSITWVPFRSPNWDTTLLIFQKLIFLPTPYSFDWYYVWGALSVPLIVLGGMLARRFKWEWPILAPNDTRLPAFVLFQTLLVFFFTPLNTSPFIYFQF